MKTNKHIEESYSPLYIFIIIRQMKGEIDTIREMKDLDDDHILSEISNLMETYLDDCQKQFDN